MKPHPDVSPARSAEVDRLHDLVADALELPSGERLAFLTTACGDDAALLEEACSLVEYDQPGDGFLARPAYAQVAGEDLGGTETGSLAPSTLLGEYRVLSLLGEGGMGEVYLAEDTRLERRVAVKLLKRRLDDASLARRFRHERKVLAALTHPNIARLYGGGTTDERQSYLVMEYVEGERLDKFCEARNLGLTERLTLFRKVCAAVTYAHQNLVVHRDLKPANIRVTVEGEPKLLDFGIAKLLNPEGTTTRSDPTVTMQGAMTPEYASPEQIKAEPVTTASDVYSLGVVLYELLTGQRPFAHLYGRRPDELARAICEEEPPRPSSAVSRTKTAMSKLAAVAWGKSSQQRLRLLEGDLDNIVAKALRKEPSRRYSSAATLAEDLRRHGEGLPVSARRDTLAYRTGKLIRRNKMAVVAAILVVLALVGGLVATALEAHRANRRFEDVRQLARSNLFEIEPLIANLPGSTEARSALVKRALEYLDTLSQEAGHRRDLERELAAAYEKVGDVQGKPGSSNLDDKAGALASYAKAQHLRVILLSADPTSAQARQELAACDGDMGVILWWNNQTTAAQEKYREALDLWQGLVREQPRSVEFRRGLATVLTRIADVLSWNAPHGEAMANYRQAETLLRDLVREVPRDFQLQLSLARCLLQTGETQKELGDYEGAMHNLAEAAALAKGVLQQDLNNAEAQRARWYALYLEAETLLARKSPAEALEMIPEMVASAEVLARSDLKNGDNQHNLAISYEARASAFQQTERWPEALEAFQQALAIDTNLASRSPENGEYAHSCGTYRSNMGRVRLALDQLAEAETDAQAAEDLLKEAAKQDPGNPAPRRDMAPVYELRGELCERLGHSATAQDWFHKALETINHEVSSGVLADQPGEWRDLRDKLNAKTAPVVVATPLPATPSSSP